MPVTLPGILGVLTSSLAASGALGTSVPTFCRGIANGVVVWVPQIRITTVDVGIVGAGKNVPLPLTVLSPTLYGGLLAGMAANSIAGTSSPTIALGIANGLSLAFLQMLVSTTHPSVGVGTGVAKFAAPPAAISMIQGFQSAGLIGDGAVPMAKAIAQSLDTAFASLLLPIVIVGSPSTAPSSGSGFGSLI